MRKLVSLLGLIFTFNTFAYGQQVLIDIPLTVVNGPYSQVLAVGGDQTATNGIDARLGENILPPPPPFGTFDIRFDLTPYGTVAGTLKDYRYYPEYPVTETLQHTLVWQLASSTTTLVLNYGLPSGATMNIQDGFGGIIFNSGTLSGVGKYSIPFPSFNQAIVTMTYINIPVNQPLISVTPTSLSLGLVNLGNNSTKLIKVSNEGNRPLNISDIISSDSQFTFTPNTFPMVIAVGANQVFNVTYTPTAIGSQSGTLTFTHDAPDSQLILLLSGTGKIQGGLLRFAQATMNLPDGTTNNRDTVVLENYTGQPMKELKFDLVIGKSNGKLILRSVARGSAIPEPLFNFSYEIYPGTPLPDGSSRDTVNVTIEGKGTNSIQPATGVQEILKFSYDIVNIPPPDRTTTNALENVFGLTETPVVSANIFTGPDEIINIWVGNFLPLFGDVNLDDHIDILDIFPTIDHILGRVTLAGLAFTIGDMAPWTFGNLLPSPDGLINELDLSVLRYIVLTGTYPSYTPVYKTVVSPFDITYNTFRKITPGMNAKLTFYLAKNGITVRLESINKVKGVQIELNGLHSIIPGGTKMTSVFEQALYFPLNDFLRILTYDPEALTIDAGEYMLVELPFASINPEAITIEKIFIADEYNRRMDKIEVEIRYEEYSAYPLYYVLEQNYPNPFNSTTKVKFSIPKSDVVQLKVYDLLGNEIKTLLNEYKQAGVYEVEFNASYLPSGVYFYRMITGSYSETKKMILLR